MFAGRCSSRVHPGGWGMGKVAKGCRRAGSPGTDTCLNRGMVATKPGPKASNRMVDQSVGYQRSITPAPLTPRDPNGRCGRCQGFLFFDADLEVDRCRSCSRSAGPAGDVALVCKEPTCGAVFLVSGEVWKRRYCCVDCRDTANRRSRSVWAREHYRSLSYEVRTRQQQEKRAKQPPRRK